MESGGFPEPFPDVVLVELGRIMPEKRSPTCQASWSDATAIGGKMDEKLQEVGMYRFMTDFYPHSTITRPKVVGRREIANTTLYYLPLCSWAEVFVKSNRNASTGEIDPAPKQSIKRLPLEQAHRLEHQQNRAVGLFSSRMKSEELQKEVFEVLQVVPGGRVFQVIPNGMMIPSWQTIMVRVRALRVDSTKYAGPLQGIMPQSTSHENCPDSLPIEDPTVSRPDLVSAVGVPRNRSNPNRGVYNSLRPKIYAQLQSIAEERNVVDIDAVIERTPENYARSFFRSKFCFVMPGDSQSTSQSSRAMCGGCVPIFVVVEPRDLPFANILDYRTFSLVVEVTQATRPGGVRRIYDRLRELDRSGEYERLRQNVRLARPFFNYHRFDALSPYGAAIASMMHDEEIKFA